MKLETYEELTFVKECQPYKKQSPYSFFNREAVELINHLRLFQMLSDTTPSSRRLMYFHKDESVRYFIRLMIVAKLATNICGQSFEHLLEFLKLNMTFTSIVCYTLIDRLVSFLDSILSYVLLVSRFLVSIIRFH